MELPEEKPNLIAGLKNPGVQVILFGRTQLAPPSGLFCNKYRHSRGSIPPDTWSMPMPGRDGRNWNCPNSRSTFGAMTGRSSIRGPRYNRFHSLRGESSLQTNMEMSGGTAGNARIRSNCQSSSLAFGSESR